MGVNRILHCINIDYLHGVARVIRLTNSTTGKIDGKVALNLLKLVTLHNYWYIELVVNLFQEGMERGCITTKSVNSVAVVKLWPPQFSHDHRPHPLMGYLSTHRGVVEFIS